MANIILFVPKKENDAKQNLQSFVDLCRSEIKIFGADLKFDNEKWDISTHVDLRGHGNKKFTIEFSNLDTAGNADITPLRSPFINFAKSYIRYTQGFRPVQNQQFRMTALRALERSLLKCRDDADPIYVDFNILNVAAALGEETQSDGVAYRVGRELEHIAKFLDENKIGIYPLSGWKSSLKRPIDPNIKFGDEFTELREKRLPDQEALEALPVAFRLAKSLPDIVVTSCAGLLVIAPERINEVLTLSVDCQLELFHKPTEKMRYGIRWPGSKEFEDGINWLPNEAVSDLAKESISRLIAVTNPARELAEWYESNPTKLYLSPELEYLRAQEYVGPEEFCRIIGTEPGRADRSMRQWCEKRKIYTYKINNRLLMKFVDLEEAIVAMLPKKFPILDARTNLKYSEALFVVPKYGMAESRGFVYKCMIEPVTINQVNDGLGSRSKHDISSVFTRLNLKNSDGENHRITSHQFRHYLNTIAQMGGLSELDIAQWSGRKDIRQNVDYDHVSSDHLLGMLREDAESDLNLPVGVSKSKGKKPLIRRMDFISQLVPAAHTTDFGWCTHDYASSPCQTFRDCINCKEQVCLKGANSRLDNIRKAIIETDFLLNRSTKEDVDGAYGASRWVKHQRKTLERLTQLEELMVSSIIPDGTPIRLNVADQQNLIRVAIDGRKVLFGQNGRSLPLTDANQDDGASDTGSLVVQEWEVGDIE